MPSPVNQKTMDFPEAIQEVINGRKVTKLEWDDPTIYVYLTGGFLSIRKEDGLHRLLLSDGDLLGTDWVTADHNA